MGTQARRKTTSTSASGCRRPMGAAPPPPPPPVDFNRDGNSDILWRNQASGANSAWFMNGATQIGGAYLTTVSDVDWRIVGLGDFNGDGKPDILWRRQTSGANYVWLM